MTEIGRKDPGQEIRPSELTPKHKKIARSADDVHRSSDDSPAPTILTDAEIEQDLIAAFTPPLSQVSTPTTIQPPVFGEANPEKYKQKEDEKWLTLGIGTKFQSAPGWDPDRYLLGVVDKPTPVQIIQEVRGPNGRLAIEVRRTYKDREGKEHTRRFWVHPKKGGFEGMPKQAVSRPTLKLDKLVSGEETN